MCVLILTTLKQPKNRTFDFEKELILTTLKQPKNRIFDFEKNYDFLWPFEKTQLKREGVGQGK